MVRLQSVAVSTQPFPPSPFEIAAEAAAAAESMAATAGGLLGGPAAGALGAVGGAVATVDSAVNALGAALGQKVPLEVYEHHAPFLFPKWAFGSDEAPRILRQKRRRASIAEGEGGCSDFSPAHRFTIDDHPAGQLDGAYVVTSVEHRGEAHPSSEGAWRVYWNTFECAPAQMPYVPARPKRRSVQVMLTATVVGAQGDEICVDEKGQIKVQFHWDREGTYDQNSSCWIRTMQAWAGAAWGHQFIPRVGMEVVVVFEGGDPDKPLVLGSVNNGTHPPPFALPGDKTRSGIRTQSSPGGGGFNELSFEDAAGREQVYLHAQRNLDERVEKNHTLLVGNDEFLRIVGNRLDRIEKNLEELVKGDHNSTVDGNRVDVVTGNRDNRVSGMLVTRVEGKERRDVQGTADLGYADDLTTRVEGCLTTLVGKPDKKRAWVTHAEGTAALSGLDQLKLSSDKELVLGVGTSSIRITANGIELSAAGIRVKGGGASLSASDDGLSLSSKGDAQLVAGKKVVLKSTGASVALDQEAKIDGQRILLNSPAEAKDAVPKDPDPPTKIELEDDEGKAVAQQRFLIKMTDGTEMSGLTDKDGKAEMDLKSGGKIIFPDVKMPGDTVKGKMMPYVVRQGDYLTKLAFVYGFDADEVWNDPKNAAVKKQRKSPSLLHPGDIVYFAKATRAGLLLQKGTTNTYTVKVPKTSVNLSFNNENGPIANEPYVVDGLGEQQEGSTDGAGKLTLQVPVHLREVHVIFPRQNIGYPVRIGDMDPIDEPAGVRKRLQHLGYQAGDDGNASEDDAAAADQQAISAFQKAKGLPVTGVVDDGTKQALTKEHGC